MNWLMRRFQTWILSLVMPSVMEEIHRIPPIVCDCKAAALNPPVPAIPVNLDHLEVDIHQRFIQIENKLLEDLAQFDGVRLRATLDRDKELQQMHKELTGMNNVIGEFQERARRYNEALGRSKNFAGMPRL